MKISLRLFPVYLVLFAAHTFGCKSAKPFYYFSAPHATASKTLPKTETTGAAEISITVAVPAKARPETVAKSLKKVKPILAQALAKPNATFYPENPTVFPAGLKQKAGLQKIKSIKDEPVKGPVYVLSGIFLALGMALLLTALILLIIGSGGAGTFALLGGASFLVGSILGMVCLLSY